MALKIAVERWLRQQWTRRGLWYVLCWWPALIFGCAVRIRRGLYLCGLLKTTHFDTSIIVVGNISVGGTGKTPLVIWLVNTLKEHGWTVGVVSRGYGGIFQGVLAVHAHSSAWQVGDEPLLIAKRTGVPVFVSRQRVLAVQALLNTYPQCNVIVSDDGLQHFALARDIEIAVLADEYSNGALLPAGDLREPRQRLLSVDAVVVRQKTCALTIPQFQMQIHATAFYQLINPSLIRTVADFTGERVLAVTGIAHPQRFADSLSDLGLNFEWRVYADHHPFTISDMQNWQSDSIVMTEKDAMKCLPFADGRIWVLAVDAIVDNGLWALVSRRLNETFAKVGERDEVQGVRNTGGETYQRDRRGSE